MISEGSSETGVMAAKNSALPSQKKIKFCKMLRENGYFITEQ